MANIIKFEYQRYSIDWLYTHTKEIDLDIYPYFELQIRLGNWYLQPFKKLDKSPWYEPYYESYEVTIKTIAQLQKHITSYGWMHQSEGDKFPDIMIKLMNRIKEYKE